MKVFLKILAAASVLVLGVMALSYLQFRFDRSDIKHALQALRLSRPLGEGDATLEEKILSKYGVRVDQVLWRPQIESKVRGTVQIEAQVPGTSDALIWKVDLVGFQIMPVSEAARRLGQERIPKTF